MCDCEQYCAHSQLMNSASHWENTVIFMIMYALPLGLTVNLPPHCLCMYAIAYRQENQAVERYRSGV